MVPSSRITIAIEDVSPRAGRRDCSGRVVPVGQFLSDG